MDGPYLLVFLIFFGTLTSLSTGDSTRDEVNIGTDVYQNPFCQLTAEQQTSSEYSGDTRFAIHSFAILHGRLFLMGATSLFNVSLDAPGPPYLVHESLQWTDFNPLLSNLIYDTSHVTSRLFTSVGFEVDAKREVMLLGFEVGLSSVTNPDQRYDITKLPYFEKIRETVIAHEPTAHYQPNPQSFEWQFSALISESPYHNGTVTLNGSRFISQSGGFFHVECTPFPLNGSNLFIHRFDDKPGLHFTITEYFHYRVQSSPDTWILSPLNSQQMGASYERLVNCNESMLLKNGYIHKDRLYLASWLQLSIEVYTVNTTDSVTMELKLAKVMPAREMINCQLENKDSGQFTGAILVSLLIILLMSAYLTFSKMSSPAQRYLLKVDGTLYTLNDDIIFSVK